MKLLKPFYGATLALFCALSAHAASPSEKLVCDVNELGNVAHRRHLAAERKASGLGATPLTIQEFLEAGRNLDAREREAAHATVNKRPTGLSEDLEGELTRLQGEQRSTTSALPPGVANLIEAEQNQLVLDRQVDRSKIRARNSDVPKEFQPEPGKQITLESYWIPESKLHGIEGDGFSPGLQKLFVRNNNGVKEYRLLVHPLNRDFYASLVEGAEKGEEFLAMPTASNRSLVAWMPGKESQPFVAKVSLDRSIGGTERNLKSSEVASSIGVNNVLTKARKDFPDSFQFMPETFGVYPKGTETGGMIIREFPPEMLSGKEKFVPLFSLYGGDKNPQILEMISKSGLDANQFVREKIIEPFVRQ